MTREQLKEFVKRMTETSGLSEEQLAEKINDAFDNKSKPSLPFPPILTRRQRSMRQKQWARIQRGMK